MDVCLESERKLIRKEKARLCRLTATQVNISLYRVEKASLGSTDHIILKHCNICDLVTSGLLQVYIQSDVYLEMLHSCLNYWTNFILDISFFL